MLFRIKHKFFSAGKMSKFLDKEKNKIHKSSDMVKCVRKKKIRSLWFKNGQTTTIMKQHKEHIGQLLKTSNKEVPLKF